MLKRLFVGRPLASDEAEHQRIKKVIALAVFSSDAISSTAYATEEILFVTAAGASSLALGLNTLIPIGIAVIFLLTIVVTSYRQTIFAYPSGGGSYVVSRENLGEYPALIAGASLLVDYILTVAVSISAGVLAIISIPSLHRLADYRVLLCLFLVMLITMANLRGVKESGRIFAVPTYIYIITLTGLVVYGLYRVYIGHIPAIPFDPEKAEHIKELGGNLTLFVLLKGFSSGAVALTGVEAISNGVPAFERPEPRNAATTMIWMGTILGTLFMGVSILAHHLQPYPREGESVFSQMGRAVFGNGPIYVVLQFATAAILTLAANTAYADFPRLSSIIARDGYLPRQFANRGDRLVFSNGVVFLGLVAGGLLVAFGGNTNKLIPLYAVGVFTSFTLSQFGMVRHHQKEREPHWKRGVVINLTGSIATAVVTLIVAITKFAGGAWIPLVLVPIIVATFAAIKRHYDRVGHALAVTPEQVQRERNNHTVVVLVGRVHKGVIKALNYAKSLRPNHLVAVYVSYEEGDYEHLQQQWNQFGFTVDLEIVHSPYRDLVDPVLGFLDELEDRWTTDTITVLIPEFVVGHWYEQILHNQSALQIKLAMIRRENTVVTSVPYHVGSALPKKRNAAPEIARF